MASSAQTSVNTTATLIDTSTGGARSVLLRNRGSVAVYLGGIDVASNTGFQLDPGESVTLDVGGSGAGGGLYGRTASSSATVHVLQVG
jgi:hypothetical protein